MYPFIYDNVALLDDFHPHQRLIVPTRGEDHVRFDEASWKDGHVRRVTGVHTSGGDVDADLVVDASGRRSSAASWLQSIGARQPVDEVFTT